MKIFQNRTVKKKRFTLRQTVKGADTFQIGPQFLGYPLALAAERAIRMQIASQPDAAPATIARRRARGSMSTQKWNDTGHLHDQLEVKFTAPDKYHVRIPTNRLVRDPVLMEQFRADIPVAGNATELINHPEVRQGVLEVLALLLTDGKV